MTMKSKLSQLKVMLGFKTDEQDDVLAVYLKQAEHEILSWRYGASAFDDGDLDMELPAEYDVVQIHAVLVGFNIRGAENQTRHDENGIDRIFVYEDMVHYIHAHVPQIVKVF